MHTQTFKAIADRFHGDIRVAQGVPYSIVAMEDIIAIGSSDGSVRLFDTSEQEIKVLSDKSVAGNAVTCLDMKRVGEKQEIFVVAGHAKGQVSVYIIRGLF
jgi:WD40 repeat protein